MAWAGGAINIRSLRDCRLRREFRIAERIADCEENFGLRIANCGFELTEYSTAIIRKQQLSVDYAEAKPKIKDLRSKTKVQLFLRLGSPFDLQLLLLAQSVFQESNQRRISAAVL